MNPTHAEATSRPGSNGHRDTRTDYRMESYFLRRGFLPEQDPVRRFTTYPELSVLDELGRDLPSLLHDRNFRQYVRELKIPEWPETTAREEILPELRLYYVRLGFLASAYVNQVGQEPATLLPRHIAVPLARACQLLNRPPILSYH